MGKNKITDIKGLNPDDAKNAVAAMNELLKATGSVEKATEAINQATKNYTRSLQQSTSELEKIAKKVDGINKGYNDLSSKLRSIEDANKDALQTIRLQNFALQNNLKASEAEAILARNDLVKEAKKLGLTIEETQEILKQYDQLQKNLHIQEEQEELAERILEYDEERLAVVNKIKANSQVLKDIITDQRAAAAIFTGQLIKGYETTKELFEEVRHEGHTIGQAFHEVGLAMTDAFSLSGASAKDSLEVMAGMRSEMGSVHHVTREARLEAASLAKTFGISNQEAGKLTAQFATMPGATMESANNSLEFAGNLAKAAGVSTAEVMRDVANSSEDVAAFSKDGGKNILTAAVAAKKLGMEFGSLTKMADQLLDFESSINKQMEASVLLGKEINLDKAREAALNGDLVGMTQEVLANVGGEAEFNKMNYQQRKALAASLGVSVTDLGKMVKHQDELANLTQEQQEALAAGETSMDEILANTSGFAGKLKEGGLTLVSAVGSIGAFNDGLKSSKELATSVFGGIKSGLKGMQGGGGLKGGLKGMFGMDKAKEGAEDAAKKSDKVKGGGGFKGAMSNLAEGFKQMGGPKVLDGIKNTAKAGPAMLLGIAAVPFMAFVAMLGTVAGKGLQGLSEGLKGKGMGAALVSTGVANLAAFGLAGAVGMLAIPFMLTMLLGKFIGAGLKGLASGLKAMADPMVAIGIGLLSLLVISVGAGMALFGLGIKLAAEGMAELVTAISEIPIENLLLMPIALVGIAAGMGLLAVASLAAAPGLILASVGLNSMVPGMVILAAVAATGALKLAGDAFTAMATSGPGMLQVGAALLAIGGGLTMMAIAGLGAMPVIGALIALAAVAPALSSLGDMFGGGEEEAGGGEEDKMQILIEEIRGLRTEMSKGGEVKMDGKKVGEVLRLAMNTSGVR